MFYAVYLAHLSLSHFVRQAFDIDLGDNSVISYSITDGNTQNSFTIDSATGEIGLTAPLDYEILPVNMTGTFQLTVMAADSGIPSLSSTTTVIINVEDVNDELPYFNPNQYSASISENSTGGMSNEHYV